MDYFKSPYQFVLESGNILPELTIAYTTYGTLNPEKSNVVWICHALTANSEVQDWWPGMVGPGKVLDPEKYFIVCANMLGSCYGTTGPLSVNPLTKTAYLDQFPKITIRDMTRAHILLRQHLKINSIFLLIGGSMGGYQALEWCLLEGNYIQHLFLLATSAAESAWGIAVHTAQRLAIEADPTWKTKEPNAGKNGLKAARAIGMLTYRNYSIMVQHQTETDIEKTDGYKAASYIEYQGEKLAQRFNAASYWLLTKAMDSHQLMRGRNTSIQELLGTFQQKTLIIGISSDILCPLIEQKLLNRHIPGSTFIEIDSKYGHDGFMVESKIISQHLSEWLGDDFILNFGAAI